MKTLNITLKLVSIITESGDTNLQAGAEYFLRKHRYSNPSGQFDSAGRFYISEQLQSSVREPSRNFPYSQMAAGRTLKHCVHLLAASDSRAARRAAKALEEIQENEIGGKISGIEEAFKFAPAEFRAAALAGQF